MSSRMQMPELKCMDPENYRKYFRSLCWSGTRKGDKKPNKKIGKKEKLRRLRAANSLTVCYAPALLSNPSQFAVYAAVRRSILMRWRYLQHPIVEISDDDDEDTSSQLPLQKLPRITGIGLKTVFALISQSRSSEMQFCEVALKALLDVLQGHAPEELSQEPTEIIANLHTMLVEVANGKNVSARLELPSTLTSLSSSCLIALSVARGESELILNAVASLIMSNPDLSEQNIQIPTNLTTLQRSVQSVILGSPSRNQWLNYGVPHQSLVTSFPVDLPTQLTSGTGDLVVRSLVSDGCYLYVFTSRGLLKIGSGYGSSIKQHVYVYKPDFFASERHGWLGYCKDKLYVRIGRKKTEVFEVDKDSLEVKNVIRLEPGHPGPVDPKSAVFTDGNQLGVIFLTNYDNLSIRLYDVDQAQERHDGTTTLISRKELNVHLLRRRTMALGRAPFEDILARRSVELDSPVAMQLEDCDDDPLVGISAGQDFALLTTASGKVYYTGKTTSLGYKMPITHTSRWIIMKESVFTKNDMPNQKKCKVVQVAIGHEGLHAILVLDNGSALFTGVARRGEDGDTYKHRRNPKPVRPKKFFKAEGHHIVYAACNYGSTALVTRQGLLLMFGKDTQHCEPSGIVTALRHERIIQVALGKAHAVALTNFGQVYTFGINNKGQCGREFGYARDRSCMGRRSSLMKDLCTNHTWVMGSCQACVFCREQSPTRVEDENFISEETEICSVCSICHRCADGIASAPEPDDDGEASTMSDTRDEKEGRYYEGQCSGWDAGDCGVKASCSPPARVAVPGAQRVRAIAAGLHHTILLTENGEVLTFGSNQFGQLGTGDVNVHQRVLRVRVPRAAAVAAGSNHSAVLTRDGELYTFGSYQKGALGRPRLDEQGSRSERSPIWYATPGRVPRFGPRHACKAVWITASGDQTFVQVSQSVIQTDTLFSSTITANHNSIVILPNRPEHTFKCITINKMDGSCNAWTGPEQVDFVNSLACLDPLYDILWSYQPQMRVIKCYNVMAYDSHKISKCCSTNNDAYTDVEFEYPNHGIMKRLDEFKNLENFEVVSDKDDRPADAVALTTMSVLNQELAIPVVTGCKVTRLHLALHLLGCLDSLTYAYDNKLTHCEPKKDEPCSPVVPIKGDFQTVNRFESHGGGWGYSGHSVEAIRFMCDADIILGGYGLYGGRGDYTAKIKLFDLGPEGGEQEGDGDLVAESEEVVYECAPRDKFPLLFEGPVPLLANRWYVAWACISGPSSDCGSSGQAMVINDEIGFHFKTSKKSNNGTDVNAGQIPCILYNVMSPDQVVTNRHIDPGEPVIALTKNISRKVTVQCFKSLIKLLRWSWDTFKAKILETNGQITINYQKLTMMKHQKRLVYVIRACLRLVKSYINEIYPQNNRKRNSHEYMSYYEAIAEVRCLIQAIVADDIPTCSVLPRRPGKNKAHRVCYVQFALELTNTVLSEAHDTITACFHAFFPTPVLKWNQLCSLLFHVKDGVVQPSHIRELTSTCFAISGAKSLRDVLHYVVPLTQKGLASTDTRRSTVCMPPKIVKDVPSKSATVPRSSHAPKPPPVPPRANREHKHQDAAESKSSHLEWNLLDAIPRLLDIVMIPIKQQMMTRQCGQPHDHGELKQNQKLSEFCCKLCARIVGELCYSASNIKEDLDTNTVKHLVTPSRFMRVNNSRVWNTGNGSPDAICFTVDRPGIMLVGACVYGGLGISEYTLELLHDVRQLRDEHGEETEPSHCWMSVDVVNGTYSASECQHEIAHIKFERPVPLKEDLRYALRLCNHGGRTANGDCGLPSVKGTDGTTFKFASCSLSFNGTTLARGQIPSLIYYGTSKSTYSGESTDALIIALRTITLRVVSTILDRCAELFCSLRNELTAEDLRRNASVLQQSPAVNILVPFTLANLEGLEDSKSVVKVLEMLHNLLPHVTAMNLLVPVAEETTTTTTHYYTWVESEHPYNQASVSNIRVLFPANVSWVVLEMDPRSITAQPEDTLTVFAVAGVPKSKPCQCYTDAKSADPPFRKRVIQLTTESGEAEEVADDPEIESPCAHYSCTYISVTPKLANVHSDWPQKSILVPGNEVIFSLETASDYLNEYNKTNNEDSRFGFRCLCVGYEDAAFSLQRQGLVALEMELVYAGAACAARLLAPDLDVVNYAAVMDVQLSAILGPDEDSSQDGSEALFLSRGLDLSSLPAVHHVLAGLPLPRCMSTELQFLSDMVAGAESTAGGRLARWLAPTPRVEPTKCELKRPLAPPQPGVSVNLPVLIRDQYGEAVTSPALKVEVIVQKLGECDSRHSRVLLLDARRANLPDMQYSPVRRDSMCFQAITMMKAYQNCSFEELRLASGLWSGGGGVGSDAGASSSGGGGGSGAASLGACLMPPEKIAVRAQPDGTFHATWLPKAAGSYVFRCTFDDIPTAQELTVEVTECSYEGPSERSSSVGASGGGGRGNSGGGASSGEAACCAGGAGALPAPASPSRLRRFPGTYSAGLRVRSSPSLQAEEIGRVPPGAEITIVEEVSNKDGTWVRLSAESARAFADSCGSVAWCLQHHRHLDRALLLQPPPSPTPLECVGFWLGCGEAQGEMPSWTNDEDLDTGSNVDLSTEDRKFPFTITIDMESDSGSSSPYMFPEPSKRTRYAQNEASASSTPRKSSRNGNSDEWWSPIRHRSSENLQDIDGVLETDIDLEPSAPTEPVLAEAASSCVGSRLAQAGTQTSPEDDAFSLQYYTTNAKPQQEDRLCRGRSTGRVPPATPSAAPLPPAARKLAQSPAQAECLRAVFAALLWHEGIVHDAIACAAFLKFHPTLGKQGARVATRPAAPSTSPRQRHSVEVGAAGQYLRIQPSTLETLTRSAVEANASRRKDSTLPHRREIASDPPAVVNVLPPALRALVALWDAMYDSDQMSPATDKNRKEPVEKNENNEPSNSGGRISFWKSIAKAPYTVQCELCGGASVPPPIAAHMRNVHLGCRTLSSMGYDRTGVYVRVDPPPRHCGSLGQAPYQLWYVFCEQCRDKCISSAPPVKQVKKALEIVAEKPEATVDHVAMKANALFLLDLAPLNAPEASSSTPWGEGSEGIARSPPTPPGSMWLPAPPFQCLPALGAAPRPGPDLQRYHSLGRPMPALQHPHELATSPAAQWPRVHRSISMGQAGRELSQASRPPLTKVALNENQDSLPGAGSSLLSQPSAALQRLVRCGDSAEPYVVSALEPPQLDTEALMKSPVLTFVVASRDLETFRQKMDAAVRMNTVRQYAFEALNWLLRSCTHAGCVHDVLWWFCNALDKFARLVPPPPPDHDNKEAYDVRASLSAPAPTSALCPGGGAAGARAARAALHALLGSVSALAPALAPASAAALQAVRCWALHYTPHDRPFLHRSQVFNVISKILSHSEDNAYEEGMLGALHESFHSYLNKESYVWYCPDVTGWCDVAVSSRQGMAGALTDGSTETFWESGDEDRNKAKWIQVTYPGGAPEDRPYILAIHIDNTRDTANKTLLLTFMYSGGTSELYHMLDQEVDPKNAAWICYTLPRSGGGPIRIRCELRGPEAAVRVRQLRVLSTPAPLPSRRGVVLHALCEADTLRVFRLLTSQVFGKLLQWERGGSEAEEGSGGDDVITDDSDLREHVVGILFAGHKLTSLQRQVMAHIVSAVGCEAARVRDDWETALLCAAAGRDDPPSPAEAAGAAAASSNVAAAAPRPSVDPQDNYCFEMLSMLLALSGSAPGRAHLAQRNELLTDLLALLHTGSERVQRQVISLLRRMIQEIPPHKMNLIQDGNNRVTLLDHLIVYLAKAISLQVKVKGSAGSALESVMMGSSVTPVSEDMWFMKGETTKKHANLVSRLLSDMAEDKVSSAWGDETRAALATCVSRVALLSEAQRAPELCVASPVLWMCLAALCVCQQEHVDMINSSAEERQGALEATARGLCANHDDGATPAAVACRACGPLCAECDRCLHLRRAARTHHRQIVAEEESAIRVDIHEGCGRVKLHWLLVLAERRALKALAEFRGLARGAVGTRCGVCRYCGASSAAGLLALGDVCAAPQCQELGAWACVRVHGCGHSCGGVRGERTCLPCLHGCAGAAAAASLRQDADDMCMICFTDPLHAAPALQLTCGHVFHLHCCKKVLANKWNGPRITFSFSLCPICKEDMFHWALEELLAPINRLREEVRRKALMRLEYEGGSAAPGKGKASADPAAYAMDRYAYYVCHKCEKAYFGGLARCEAESNGWWEPSELVCGACSDVAGARTCAKHGGDFLEYKCRYCCSVAVFFCFGTSHFCNACHDDFQRVTNIPKHLLPQCPAGPKGEQLPGTSEECPLRAPHPPTGEEFALGCGVCRHKHAF